MERRRDDEDQRDATPAGPGLSQFFATCHPGLEAVVAAELAELGVADIQPGRAGVAFKATRLDSYRANLWLRSAVRVLMLLGRSKLDTDLDKGRRGGEALYDFIRRAAPWEKVIPPGLSFSIEVRAWDNTDINNTAFVWTRTKDAICDAIRDARDDKPDPPQAGAIADVPLYLTMFQDKAQIFRDMSGDSLHRRGYRDVMHKAALNEAAAAGMLALAGWPEKWAEEGGVAVADPMCGSGTLLIEAALSARNIAPGLLRRPDAWPFLRWPDHKQAVWEEAVEGAKAQQRQWRGRLLGNDIHEGALGLAVRQARAAGVDDCITFSCADARAWVPPSIPRLVVSNPPWGLRLGPSGGRDGRDGRDRDGGRGSREPQGGRIAGGGGGGGAEGGKLVTARDHLDPETTEAWRSMDQFLYHQCPGSTAYLLSGNKDCFKWLKLKPAAKHALTFGGVDVAVASYQLRPRGAPAPAGAAAAGAGAAAADAAGADAAAAGAKEA